ncbi:S8 family peptidase [Cryobacterium tagatosivorans]|nr:S8 family peptidase [Cryobacterium tagatosivorans]
MARNGSYGFGRAAFAVISATVLALGCVGPAHAVTGLAAMAITAPATTATETETYIVDAATLAALNSAVAPLPDADVEVLPELGKAIVDLTAAQATRLDATPGVTVAADEILSLADAQDSAPWNLDRLDQSTPSVGVGTQLGQYWYPHSAGSGVRIYIVDSGVWAGHPDFAGRIIDGYDAIGQLEGPTSDCNGHGTAVASAAAGTVNGAAKLATIVPVKVADCLGHASTSAVIDGLNWIAASNPADTPAAINISLGALDKDGSAGYALMEDAVATIVAQGFFVSIAAGNEGFGDAVPEACQFSPARTPTAFTAGAADAWLDEAGVEGRAWFSNAGSCVDAFAPGVNIMTASLNGAPDAPRDGTSFGAPMVTGLAALHLADHASDTPQQTTDALLASAQTGALADTPARRLDSTIHYDSSTSASTVVTPSPNLLVRTPAPVPPTPGAVANFRSSARTATSLTFAWDEPTDVRLTIEGGGRAAAFVNVAGTEHTFTGLTGTTTYTVTATALSDGLLGATSTTLAAITSVGILATATPTISGTMKVGYVLTATAGVWGPPTVTLRAQWYRSGVAIAGATARTYKVGPADVGKAISVRVTGSRAGYTTATSASSARTVVVLGSLVAPTPTISGTRRSGYTLTANGIWGPGAVALTYRWYRSGVPIKWATAKTYRLTYADRFDTIRVRVTGIKTGYTGVGRYSAPTVRIP